MIAFLFMDCSSSEPNVETVQDTDGREDCACNQKAPSALRKTGEDVREPRDEARDAHGGPD
jgi:hypothetical protein